MKTGQILALLGGIISLVGTFVLTFFEVFGAKGSGIGLLVSAGNIFQAAAVYGEPLIYVFEILWLILIWGGVLSIVGVKVRALAIIGGIFAIFLAVYQMVVAFAGYSLPVEFMQAAIFFGADTGAFPLHVAVGDYIVPFFTAGLGIYVLLGGGVLAFVGGVMPRD